LSEVRTHVRSRVKRWTEQRADVEPRALASALRGMAPLDVIGILQSVREAPLVFFDPGCRSRILQHLQSGDTELGGLLFGWAHVDEAHGPLQPIVTIDECIPSRVFRSSRVSLAMETDVWNDARQHIATGTGMVVGWYHSHPNLGAFFSGTDRRTQRAFFAQSYSIGLVIDPVRDEEAWFWGPDSVPLSARHRIVPKPLDSDARSIEEQGKESTWAGDFGAPSP
jgi:proteasome lid subunit RPN8/RPN11